LEIGHDRVVVEQRIIDIDEDDSVWLQWNGRRRDSLRYYPFLRASGGAWRKSRAGRLKNASESLQMRRWPSSTRIIDMIQARFSLASSSAGVTALLAAAPVLRLSAADQDPSWTVETLSSPAAAESSAPELTSDGGHTILSWMERAGSRASLKFSE